MDKSILIIDDEEIITRSLKKLLKREGYTVSVVSSGGKALEEVKNKDFSLIICDVRMPQMDGIETIKRIRNILKEQGRQPVPEIIITGYADETKYKNAVDLKVADYIYKPFEIDEFLKVVRKNLNKT